MNFESRQAGGSATACRSASQRYLRNRCWLRRFPPFFEQVPCLLYCLAAQRLQSLLEVPRQPCSRLCPTRLGRFSEQAAGRVPALHRRAGQLRAHCRVGARRPWRDRCRRHGNCFEPQRAHARADARAASRAAGGRGCLCHDQQQRLAGGQARMCTAFIRRRSSCERGSHRCWICLRGDLHGVIPTRSIVAQEAAANALLSAVAFLRGLKLDEFRRSHPGGAIGMGAAAAARVAQVK